MSIPGSEATNGQRAKCRQKGDMLGLEQQQDLAVTIISPTFRAAQSQLYVFFKTQSVSNCPALNPATVEAFYTECNGGADVGQRFYLTGKLVRSQWTRWQKKKNIQSTEARARTELDSLRHLLQHSDYDHSAFAAPLERSSIVIPPAAPPTQPTTRAGQSLLIERGGPDSELESSSGNDRDAPTVSRRVVETRSERVPSQTKLSSQRSVTRAPAAASDLGC